MTTEQIIDWLLDELEPEAWEKLPEPLQKALINLSNEIVYD